MSMKLLAGLVRGSAAPAVADVFSAYPYTGNGATQTITNGINLSAYGGIVLTKARNGTASFQDQYIYRATLGRMRANGTNAEVTGSAQISSFNTTGFTLESSGLSNQVSEAFASWTLRNANLFFDVQTKAHTTGASSTVDLTTLGTVGMVWVKRTDSTGEWYVWHRSLTSGYNLRLHTTAAESNTDAQLSVSGTTLTIGSGMATGTYAVYSFTHDASGIIQCTSFTTDGSGNGSVNHGWSSGVQCCMLKCRSTTGDWELYDTARTSGWSGNDARLRPNLSNAEDSVARLSASGTTLSFAGLSASQTYVCTLIKAP